MRGLPATGLSPARLINLGSRSCNRRGTRFRLRARFLGYTYEFLPPYFRNEHWYARMWPKQKKCLWVDDDKMAELHAIHRNALRILYGCKSIACIDMFLETTCPATVQTVADLIDDATWEQSDFSNTTLIVLDREQKGHFYMSGENASIFLIARPVVRECGCLLRHHRCSE